MPPRLTLRATFEPGHRAHLEWGFRYGAVAGGVLVPLAAEEPDPMRDRAAERALVDELLEVEEVAGFDPLWQVVARIRRLVPEIRLHGFTTVAFAELLPVLEELPTLELTVVGEPATYSEAVDAPLIQVSTSDPADGAPTDWFDLGISVTVAGEDVPLAPLIEALARGHEHLILDSGTWFSLDRPELETLRALVDEARSLQDKPTDPLRISVVHAGLWEELAALGVVEQQSERWSRAVGALLDLDAVEPAELPAGLDATLRPYQVDGFRWLSLLWDCGLGGVLADDMGLGKTLQMLAMVLRAHERGELGDPVLVVAPTSVLSTWQSEAARFAPSLRTVVVDRTRDKAGRGLEETIAGAQVVITSYAVARIDEVAFRSRPWGAVVLDEAQFVKNHQAKTYQAVRRLTARAKFAITGTPLENSLMDLWSLLSIVAPGLHPRPALFKELWAKPIENGGDAERLAALRRRIRPLMLRRTKEAVATELPPKMEQVLSVDLHPRHRAIYDRHLQRERQRLLGLIDDVNGNRIAILRALTVLRQMSLDPSLVDEAYAGHRVVGEGRRPGRAARGARRGGAPGAGVLPVHRVPQDRPRPARGRGHRLRVPRRLHPQPRRAHRVVPRGHRAGVPHLAQGRRVRAHPHRGRLRVRARPVVEPGRRGPGHRPHPPHRPDPPGQRLPDGLARHHRGEGRGAAGAQARPVRPGRRRGRRDVLGPHRRRPARAARHLSRRRPDGQRVGCTTISRTAACRSIAPSASAAARIRW